MDRRSFVRDSLISVAGLSKLLADPAARGSEGPGQTTVNVHQPPPLRTAFFNTTLPGSQWVKFDAAGFSHPATGVIYRKAQPATNGMPLGGIDTGCIDLETSGLFGYSTIFNSHVPRRGPLNLPFLGLSVGGQTWVMCDPKQIKQYQTTDGRVPVESYNTELLFDNLLVPKEIHYWGHYPVADMEFETDAPITTGVRAWSPFLPGDVEASALPGMVFEVHLQNHERRAAARDIGFQLPGPFAQGSRRGPLLTSSRARHGRTIDRRGSARRLDQHSHDGAARQLRAGRRGRGKSSARGRTG